MKTEKMKVLLYLKKSGMDKSGKAPIMGRITLGRSIASSAANYPVTLICGIPVKVEWGERAVRRWK